MKCRIIILFFLSFSAVFAGENSTLEYDKEINNFFKSIMREDLNYITDHIDNKLFIGERVELATIEWSYEKNQFKNTKGMLFALLFDIQKIDVKWKKLFQENEYCAIQFILKKEIKVYKNYPAQIIIGIKYGNNLYSFIFRVDNKKIYLKELLYEQLMPWDEKYWENIKVFSGW